MKAKNIQVDPPGTVYVARLVTRNRLNHWAKRWVLFDAERSMLGEPDESKLKIVARWIDTFGDGTAQKLVRYEGVMSHAELAATMADLALQTEGATHESP